MVTAALRKDLRYGKVAAQEMKQSTHIPYLRHVEDTIVTTKQGFLISVIKLSGLCFQTLDQSEINLRYHNRNTNIRGMGSSRFAIYGHVIRRAVAPEIAGEFENPFTRELDARYMASLAERRMFVNEIYMTIVRRPMQGKVGVVEHLIDLFRSHTTGEEPIKAMQDDLRQMTAAIAHDFNAYGAQVLGIARRDGSVFSEISEFLAKLINGAEEAPMPLPRMSLDAYLPTKRLFFGSNAMEFRGALPQQSKYGAVLSIKEYPPFTAPGMLDGLLQVPHEFMLTLSFALKERSDALERMNKTGRQTSGSDFADTSIADDVDEARDRLASGKAVFGESHFSLLCLSDSIDGLNRTVHDLGAELARMNIVWVREDIYTENAFWAQLPGNFAHIARNALISSLNFSGFFSAHNFPSGQMKNLHWRTPIALLETTSQTAYYMNFHVHDLGNFTAIGPSGSGKTVLLNFLMAQAMRVKPTPRCLLFDKDRGAEVYVRALGGRYQVLTPGEPTGLNPFQLADTPENGTFLVQLLSFMLRPPGGPLSAAEASVISDAVNELFSLEREDRSLAVMSELLRGRIRGGMDDLASRLDPWLKELARGWLFNNPHDELDVGRQVVGFDMTKVLDDPEIRTAALLYIFHRVREILDGTPALIFLDEGWRLLDDEVFVDFIKDMLKTIRKQNGIVGFGTQSASDVVASKVGPTLIEQTSTNIFFPNAKADDDSYVKAFKLSKREMDFIRTTAPELRCFLIRHAQDSVIAKMNLSGMPDLIKVLSGRTETVAECERLRVQLGDDPARWLPAFCGWEVQP